MKLYVHDDFGRIVGIVSYNENLDHGNSPYHRVSLGCPHLEARLLLLLKLPD